MRAKEVNFSGLTIQDLRLLRLIGQGNWADVYLAEDIHTLQKAAVKVTPQKKLKEVPKLQELVQAEITILKQCRNNNVIRLLNDFQHADHQFIAL
jgi:serine/threonine protein kinase